MIRCKITPAASELGITIRLEWVEIQDEQIVKVLGKEEFSVQARRQGCSYVSRAAFPVGQLLPGTFWLDERGSRHFVLDAEAGLVGMDGSQAQT
jgi:hypothetical protein